jgi:GDP-L-fucose synthase
MINKKSIIYIAGHNGMVGRAVWRYLNKQGYKNLHGQSSSQLDLKSYDQTYNYINDIKPDIIINSAAKVGGILANSTFPYDFLIENMLIQNNLIKIALDCNITKFIFLGSSCIYPKFSEQPIKEKYLLSGKLEETNQWYAVAKISGVKLIESIRHQYKKDYVSLMPTNLYGPYDNFDLSSSHVLPALIRKFHEANVNNNQNVTLWGDGSALREFLHVDDLAKAVYLTLTNESKFSLYNVGSGSDLSIKNLAIMVKKITSYTGDINWDKSKPNGTPKKLLDSSRINDLGFKPSINLIDGIKKTYDWYLKNYEINN